MAWDKQKTIDRTITWNSPNVKGDVYIKSGGGYLFQNAYSGGGQPVKIDKIIRSWNNFDTPPSPQTFRATNGYLPTQSMDETRSFCDQTGLPLVVYFYNGGTYRVNMKTKDPLYIPPPSGYYDSGLRGWISSYERGLMEQDAQQKCLASARDSKVNLAVMFGEGRETIRMCTESVRTLGRAYRAFQRGNFRQVAKLFGVDQPDGNAASHWLAWHLGWKPLLSDIQGLYQLAADGVLNPLRDPRFSARGKSERVEQVTYTSPNGASFWTGGETRYQATGVTTVRAGLLLEYVNTRRAQLKALGLGAYDIISLGWELTPFSFVFDYIVNVGQFLEAASSLDGLSVKTGFVSTSEWNYGTAEMIKPSTSGWIDGIRPRADFTHRRYRRNPWTGSVSLRAPLLDGLNAKRLTTMAALWRQLTKGDREIGKYRP